MAMTILINMMHSEGRNPIQNHVREFLHKAKDYEELEEELHAELFRREADSNDKKDGGINQLDDVPDVLSDEQTWVDVWHQDLGWIQALAPAAKRPRTSDNDDEKPQDSKVPKGKGKG